MPTSVRSQLCAGVAIVATAALVASPAVVSAPPSERQVTADVGLAASVKPLVLQPLTPDQVNTARSAIARIDPQAALPVAAAAASPVTFNAASDSINSAYEFIQYWVEYGIELANYALQFIPGGFLISDQIDIFYYNLIQPINESIVYGLIDPVVNDPLNLAVWVDGLTYVGQTAVNAAINTGIAEFNYFIGWLIPPLPPLPLPPFPFAAVDTVAPALKVAGVSLPAADLADSATKAMSTTDPTEPAATEDESVALVTDETAQEGTEAPADVESTEPTAEPEQEQAPEQLETTSNLAEVDSVTQDEGQNEDQGETATASTTTSGGVQAQGEVRGGVTKPADTTNTTAARSSSNSASSSSSDNGSVSASKATSKNGKAKKGGAGEG